MEPGGGAFYAPKIDVYIEDALGRSGRWPPSSRLPAPAAIRARVPQRRRRRKRPVVIHYAIYGSFERFIGILVEHYRRGLPALARAGPGGCHPHRRPARRCRPGAGRGPRSRGLRVEVDDSDNRMQYKIRQAQEQKIPYMLVLGDREVEAGPLAADPRGEQPPAEGWETLADRLAPEAADAP